MPVVKDIESFLIPLMHAVRTKLFDKREAIHFLHIGKCAGSQVRILAQDINARSKTLRIVKHRHDFYFDRLRETDRYFFSIRDPISRFRSGFYCRKRRSQPVYDFAWSSGESLAYNHFEHANDLAEALFSEGETGRQAFMAMKSIRHTAQNQVDWFARFGDIFVTRPPVWIIRQENFEDDLAVLSRLLGADLVGIVQQQRGTGAAFHSNDYAGARPLSELAKANLTRWYAQDFEFYKACENWIHEQPEGTKPVSASIRTSGMAAYSHPTPVFGS